MIGEVSLIAIDALDKLSRQRALTDVESFNLERLIRHQEQSETGWHRLGVWRERGLVAALGEHAERPLSRGLREAARLAA